MQHVSMALETSLVYVTMDLKAMVSSVQVIVLTLCMESSSGHVSCDCIDINECADEELNNCHVNATCLDTIGSFTCTCKEGYEGNGTSCTGKCTCGLQFYKPCFI